MKQTIQPNVGPAQKSAAELASSRSPQHQAPPQAGRLAQLAAMMNGSPGAKALAQLKDDIHKSQMPGQNLIGLAADIHNERGGFASGGQVIQCLMTGKSFLARYKPLDGTRTTIGKLLTEYGSAWGWGYGYTGEYNGKFYRQERIRILADLEQNIHEHFRDSGAKRIKDAPESELMLELLDEVQEEHKKQISELLGYKDELPVADRGLSKKDKAEVIKNWRSIVEGKGNLQITEKEKNKGTKLERDHAGFRIKALSSVARLLQGAEGRKLIKEANKDGTDKTQHITIAPVSKKPHDVVEGRWWKTNKGTIPAGGWDAEALDQPKSSLKKAGSTQEGTFWDLDSDDDPLGTYELAAKKHKADGKPDGVILEGKKYVFNLGTGSTVNYITEHKDSENRVMTRKGKAWREGLSPTSVALGHELGHAVRNRRGAGVSGHTGFLKLTGVKEEQYGFWTHTDEELVNITQVENNLLKEQGLEPRIYHKDYEESLQETGYVRLNRYQKDPKYDQAEGGKIFQAIQGKKFDLAGRLLKAQGF